MWWSISARSSAARSAGERGFRHGRTLAAKRQRSNCAASCQQNGQGGWWRRSPIYFCLRRHFFFGSFFSASASGGSAAFTSWPFVAVVDADDAVLAAGRDHVAVGAGADRVDEVGRAGEVPHVAAVVGVPHPHARVAAAGQELRRLADEEQRRHLLLVPLHVADLLALLVVPHLHEVVRAAARELLAVRRPADAHDVVRVPLERLDEPRRLGTGPERPAEAVVRQLEHLHELVRAAGRQQLAVRAERDAEHRVRVAVLDVGNELAGRGEDLDLAVLGRRAAAGGEELAVRRSTRCT